MWKVKRALELNINYYLRRRSVILVYSMERSGSIALTNSLQARGEFVIGSHYLDPGKISTQHYSGSARWACGHVISKRKPAKVISLVRHPVENMLSVFARTDYGRPHDRHMRGETQQAQETPAQLSDKFCQAYLAADRHLRPLGWFANEFRPALGINIYDRPFDTGGGYIQFREGPYDVLIMRTELPNEQKAKIVSDFVGVEAIEMLSPATNFNNRHHLPPGKPGDQTDYAEMYKTLKRCVVIPPAYLDAIVDSPYVRHFFTQTERDAIRQRYRGAPTRE